MLKEAIFAAAAATSAVLAAGARHADLTAAFGNTVVSTFPDGRQGRIWFDADHSYTAEGRRGDLSQGRWTLKGGKVCLRQTHPPTLPFSFCTAVPSGGVGSTWTATSVWGDPMTVTLVAGHDDRKKKSPPGGSAGS